MSEVPSCRTSSDSKFNFWMFMIIWTTSLFSVSFLVGLFAPELVEIFLPFADPPLAIGEVIMFFFIPPIVTIWGIGIVLCFNRCRMLCSMPTTIFIASFILSGLFSFPLSTLFTIGTLIVMIYTLLQSKVRKPKNYARAYS
jgi:hypothetical protein